MTPDTTNDEAKYDRRTVLRASLAAATTAAVGASPAVASQSADASLESWLDNVGNFDGIVDATGESEVTVDVGAQGNDGAYAFGPAVVRVDPGTTVTWEWTGKGGSHNVVEKDGAFESEMLGNEGDTFDHTFESEGVAPYYCGPHKAMGMKGAVVVGDLEVAVPEAGAGGGSGGSDGDGESGDGGAGGDVDYGGWFDDVGNFDGTVDATGESEVTVEVGSEANGGAYGFGPAAIRVDPGTTVVFEWTGKGGSHNVVAEDGSYESSMQGSEGETYERTFDAEGVSKYYCGPHKAMGMKGAVVVGDPGAGAGGAGGDDGGSTTGNEDLWLFGLVGGLVAALLSPFLFGAVLFGKDDVANTDDEAAKARRH
ncbi:halocyanin domain-containing protein [Halorubellus sp. JP-L1]|uniref:halocyanin domain-containing protein n=1 Tax=Halorubellus sp. JP-L1 TaxID=2715753 RepID=UPI0014098823|nr:halocyanin domain-containing protein [Halorubellus sp. JP-L1]NHN43294.1 halocyanin domain-containing protein [Halorubellus sp. JP-L1]